MKLTDFAKAKNKNKDKSYNYLKRYIELDNINVKEANNLCNNDDIKSYNEKIAPFLKEREEKQNWIKIKNSSNEKDFENFIN